MEKMKNAKQLKRESVFINNQMLNKPQLLENSNFNKMKDLFILILQISL